MQKFYWNNSGAPPPPPCHAGYRDTRDTRDKASHPHHQAPGHSYHQTLTLAINSNNQPHDYTYIQQTNNRRAIKTNEAVNIKNNDNEFSSSQHAAQTQSDPQNSIRVQNSEIKNAAKTIHLNSSNDYYIKVNGNKQCIQVNQSYLKDAACNPTFQGSCSNRVVLKLGDISGPGHGTGSVSSELNQRSRIPTQSRWRVNKTWNENMKGKYRQSIQTADIFKHDYENVYDNTKPLSDVKTESKKDSRQTPRSRKKSKHPGNVYRSKSCERVAGVIDRLSEKLSISGFEAEPAPAPPTPTPSLLHSKLARAIPCVDIKPGCVSSGGRSSPTESLAYEGVEGPFRPAQSLADKMRGRLEYVNKKMKIIRSRSAERIRGVIRSDLDLHDADDHSHCERPARSREPVRMRQVPGSDQSEGGTRSPLTNQTAVGQARALVSCVPSPYDRDVLGFQAGDIIDVLQMNQSGLWRGRCRDRVGTFKFINVELLPTRRRKRSSSRSLRKMRASQSRPPGNITELMRTLDMAEHLPVFVLNGYEDLSLFKDLDDDELDYLGITNQKQRQKLIDMANLLFPDEKSLGAGDSSDEGSETEDSSSESGIADINSDEAYSSYNSSKHN